MTNFSAAECSEPACPQCRMQMQSRRDCKRDSRFDRLMQQLYGDLQGFEAQVEPTPGRLLKAELHSNSLADLLTSLLRTMDHKQQIL